MTVQGLTTIRSGFGPRDTMNRLEAAVKAKGLTVFARIDHAAGAAAIGLTLRPTEVLIFGNASGGTPLMQSVQTGAGLAGFLRRHLAFLQRSCLSRAAPWTERRDGRRGRQSDGRARRAGEGRNRGVTGRFPGFTSSGRAVWPRRCRSSIAA